MLVCVLNVTLKFVSVKSVKSDCTPRRTGKSIKNCCKLLCLFVLMFEK